MVWWPMFSRKNVLFFVRTVRVSRCLGLIMQTAFEVKSKEHDMGVSKNNGTPKWMVKIMENPIKQMDDLGGKNPYFWKHPYLAKWFILFHQPIDFPEIAGVPFPYQRSLHFGDFGQCVRSRANLTR